MQVISETEERTTRSAAADAAALAGPSRGSTELSSWRVRMAPAAEGPVHAIDREQVFMPVVGAFAITAEGETVTVAAGQAVVLPAGTVRQIRVAEGPAEALVCMPVGGRATIPGSAEVHRLPWAE
jgi:quercetin dioxygenase-like cupin family protein